MTITPACPILVFDAWEHAHYLQYKNVRPDYVDRLWNLVNWADVTKRFDAARRRQPDHRHALSE